jgi:hypothetical protein
MAKNWTALRKSGKRKNTSRRAYKRLQAMLKQQSKGKDGFSGGPHSEIRTRFKMLKDEGHPGILAKIAEWEFR